MPDTTIDIRAYHEHLGANECVICGEPNRNGLDNCNGCQLVLDYAIWEEALVEEDDDVEE